MKCLRYDLFHFLERLMKMERKQTRPAKGRANRTNEFLLVLVPLVVLPLIGCFLTLFSIKAAAQTPASTTHPPVEIIQATAPDSSVLKARKGSYSFSVGGSDWTDTGVVITPADHLNFTATGSLTLADGRAAPPDGLTRGWKDLIRVYPLNSANSGALIGRVGNDDAAVPFLIGAGKDVDVSATGHLYLRLNLSSDLSGTGSIAVKMKLTTQSAQKTISAPDLAHLLSPQLFADIPRRVGDLAGDPGDMVNFSVIGTQDQVTKAFTSAGWVQVDKTTQDAVVHGLISTLSHEAYTEMPMSTLYLSADRRTCPLPAPRRSRWQRSGTICGYGRRQRWWEASPSGLDPARTTTALKRTSAMVGSPTTSMPMSTRSVTFYSRVLPEPGFWPGRRT